MKKIMLAVFALSLLALGANAQDTPKADVALGYSYLHVNGQNGGSSINTNGFSGSLAYNVTSVIGVVGDFGVYHGSVSGVGINFESYLFGPRFSVRHSDKFTPFVQALFGGAHQNSITVGGVTVPGSSNFAFSFGGGTDIGIAKSGMIALRPQFDYIGVRNSGSTTSTERVSVGIVFNFGSK